MYDGTVFAYTVGVVLNVGGWIDGTNTSNDDYNKRISYRHRKIKGLFHDSNTLFLQVKAILRDVMGEEKFYFSLFFIIHLCNDPCCHRMISPQCVRAGHFA